MVVLSYSWLETFPSILLSSRVIRSQYIESRWSCIWSCDYLLRHISGLCLHWNVAFSIPNGKAELAMSSTSLFRFLCVEYQKWPWPRLNCVDGTKLPGMAKLLRRNWGPGKSLFNGSFPGDHFRLFFVRGYGGGRKKRKDLSLKQIYCPLVTSLNLSLHWNLFFLILTWRWTLARHENTSPLGYRPRLSLLFLVSFDFGVRSFTLLMDMIMSWNPSKLYKWFHCIWIFLFSWINHTDVTNESCSVSQIFIHGMWHFLILYNLKCVF